MRDPVKTVYAVTLFAMMLLAGCFGSGVVDTPEVEAQAAGSEVTLAQFTTLEGAVTAAENAITTVQTSLADHETRIAALETKLAAAEAALQGLNNQATGGTNAAPIVEIEGAGFMPGGLSDDVNAYSAAGYQYEMGIDRGCETILDSQITAMASQQYLNSNHWHQPCSTDDNLMLGMSLRAIDIDGSIASVDIDFDADGVLDSEITSVGSGYLVDLPATFWSDFDDVCGSLGEGHGEEECDYVFFIAVTDDLGARTWAVGGFWVNYVDFHPVMRASFSVNDAADNIVRYERDDVMTITPNAHWPSTYACDGLALWGGNCYDVQVEYVWMSNGYSGYYYQLEHNIGANQQWQAQQTMTLQEGLNPHSEYADNPYDICEPYYYWQSGPYAWDPCHITLNIQYMDTDGHWHLWRFDRIEIW